jgi:K+-transporting ATPase KdpF subunit
MAAVQRMIPPVSGALRALQGLLRNSSGRLQQPSRKVEEPMVILSLLLSIAAFVYLLYAMLRAERF